MGHFLLTAARGLTCLLLLYANALSAAETTSGSSGGTSPGIISIQQQMFVDADCKEFVFSGANVWNLVEAAAGVLGSKSDVTNMFQQAKFQGINLIRFFPEGVTSSLQLQTSPGLYNNQAWEAIDYILAQASDAGIKVIMPFVGNWGTIEEKSTYVAWAGLSDPDAFYTNSQVKQYYMNHVKALTSRENSITNIKYSDDGTIFAWDLMNEPRAACDVRQPNASCDPSAAANIQAWINEMAPYVKSIDPNHLLTVGEEGFYGPSSPNQASQYNPNYDSTDWAKKSGQDFEVDHESSSIDFLAIHIWPDNWQANATSCGGGNPSCGLQFITNFINSHAANAGSLQKPLVIEEFGKQLDNGAGADSERNPDFTLVYNALKTSLNQEGVLKGVAFWEWAYWSSGSSIASKGNPPEYITIGDSTWQSAIQPGTQAVQAFLKSTLPVANCIPGQNRATSLLSQSQTATAAGRRMLAAKPRVQLHLNTTYATAGVSLERPGRGQPLDVLAAWQVHECGAACDHEEACQAFSYSSTQEGGENCKLWASTVVQTLQWSTEGFQTFWAHTI